MTTWRGTLRSINSAANAAQRAAVRRQRELERQQKQAARMAEQQRAAYDVAVFENAIEVLVSVHKQRSERIDWQQLAELDPPTSPERLTQHADAARAALDGYVPRGLDKFGTRAERKRADLAAAVEQAQAQDEAAFQSASSDYAEAHQDWADTVRVAKGVVAGEAEAYLEAFRKLNTMTDVSALGSRISLSTSGGELASATIDVHGEEIVPREVKSLLQSGKRSTKQMPKGRFYEIYQDYVCGCVLRVAGELLALLPLDMVIVTAVDNLLDTSTGRLAEQPILSVAVPRDTLDQLSIEHIDPSDALANFVHHISFKKTTGFSPVKAIRPEDVSAGP
jgi:hypothetical protein